jgi:hypothetical protein
MPPFPEREQASESSPLGTVYCQSARAHGPLTPLLLPLPVTHPQATPFRPPEAHHLGPPFWVQLR